MSFSTSPLAGAPIRIARAVTQNTAIQVSHVDLKRWGTFDHDHVHEEHPEKTLTLAEQADIIHLYNYLDLSSGDFGPVDFRALRRRGVRFVRMFESTPMRVAQQMGQPLEAVLNDPIPKLVIAQYPERFLPTAQVVPNIIPETDPAYLPTGEPPTLDVVFSPSSRDSAWAARWDTKGMPETMEVLAQLSDESGATYQVIEGRPLAEALELKRQARLVIDELVTGSYHLSGLEGLSLGKPVLAFLDDRVQHVLREISGSDTCPFINVRLEEASGALAYLLKHPDETADLGKASREWIERYWSHHILVHHFVDVYEKLMTDPALVTRQESLRLDDNFVLFQALTLPDLVHRARASRYDASRPLGAKLSKEVDAHIDRLRQGLRRYLSSPFIKLLRDAWRETCSLLARLRGAF